MNQSRVEGIRPDTPFRAGVGAPGRVYEADRWLLRAFLRGMGDPRIKAALWDGEDVVAHHGAQQRMVVHDRITLLRLMTNPLLNFGDDYSTGNIEIEGGLVPFLEAVYRARSVPGKPKRRSRRGSQLLRQGMNSPRQSRTNIQHHYDIGNDFYRVWLDQEMVYTCAYYPHPHLSLEAAQLAKMDLVCRKLRLKEGDRVIEAGCGWGGLARYMAKHYGVTVRAYNVSHEQIAYARQRAQQEGIEGVEYLEDDYRNITGTCDAFVSVGMLEHVGLGHYRELGDVVQRTLSERGLGLIHSIGQNIPEPMSEWLEKRIFPGGYPPTLREMCDIFEPHGFSILDVENLRLHYARTLEHWLERFEAASTEVAQMYDESFVRAWRLYLCGAIANFSTGSLQLFQVLFARPENNDLPWSRTHLLETDTHGTL